MRVAALARKLEAEGLMREERRRPLPLLPARIGLVTSPRGKAVHDVVRTLARRYPVAELVIAGVPVEGREAVASIVAGLGAVADAGVEVALLVRGGGSYEDLMPFSDEAVARAVAGSPVPVVTGIGHEPDTTIADMVADVRASTPTAAAECVAPAVSEIDARLCRSTTGLATGLSRAVAAASHRVDALATRPVLSDPRSLVWIPSQRVDAAAGALARSLPRRLEAAGERVEGVRGRLIGAGARRLERTGSRLTSAGERLGDLSPLAILGRGYAICYGPQGTPVRRAHELAAGDVVGVRFSEGKAACTVDDVETEA
jgi:exodeoxyribonuclease VII large subunit